MEEVAAAGIPREPECSSDAQPLDIGGGGGAPAHRGAGRPRGVCPGRPPVKRARGRPAPAPPHGGSSRSAPPYNLWAHVDQMFTAEKDAPPVPPPALFVYRDPHTDVAGAKLDSFHIGFAAGFDVTWTWDAQKQVWVRTTHSPAAPDVDAGGGHIS